VDQQYGTLLRLSTPGGDAMAAAADLLGLFEAELHAEVEDTGWRRGNGVKVSMPILIRLESLEVELIAEGNEIVLSRMGGSEHEFEELCEFVREHGNVA
jgi:hypothetical protein